MEHILILIATLFAWTCESFMFATITDSLPYLFTVFQATPSDIISYQIWAPKLGLVGAILFGVLSNRFGRKWVLIFSMSQYSVFMLASAFATTLDAYMIMRYISCTALGGFGVSSVYLLENVPVKSRGLYSGIFQLGFTLGPLLSNVIAYASPDNCWKIMSYAAIVPLTIVFLIGFYVPESPVYAQTYNLNMCGKTSFFKAAVTEFASTFIDDIFAIHLMVIVTLFVSASRGTIVFNIGAPDWRGLTSDQVFANNMAGYCGALLGSIVIASASQKYGRRILVIVCALAAGALIYPWSQITSPIVVYCISFAMQFFSHGAYAIMPAYLIEISPPLTRAFFIGHSKSVGTSVGTLVGLIQQGFSGILKHGDGSPNYPLIEAALMAILIPPLIAIMAFGHEKRDVDLITGEKENKEKGQVQPY